MIFHCYDSLDASVRSSFSASWNLGDLNHCRHSTIHSSTFQSLSPRSAKEHQKATLARHAIGEVAIENPGWPPFSNGSWPRVVKNRWNWWPLDSPVITIFLDEPVWNANIGSKISQGYWWSTDCDKCHMPCRYYWRKVCNDPPSQFLYLHSPQPSADGSSFKMASQKLFLNSWSIFHICETSLGGLVRKKKTRPFFALPFVRFTSLLHIVQAKSH